MFGNRNAVFSLDFFQHDKLNCDQTFLGDDLTSINFIGFLEIENVSWKIKKMELEISEHKFISLKLLLFFSL